MNTASRRASTASPRATVVGLRPTGEQGAVIDGVRDDENLVIQARAGTGKTEALGMATRDQGHKRTLYLAYNKSIANEARRRFKAHVQCRTLHSLAFAETDHWARDRLTLPRQNGRAVASILKISEPFVLPAGSLGMPAELRLSTHHLGRLVLEGLRRFSYSADPEPTAQHTPRQPGLTPEAQARLADHLAPLLRRGWADLNSKRGQLRLEHDHYLKMWALTEPALPFDLVLLDEAQDSNRLTSSLIASQSDSQTVVVGDSAQQLYAWRGATDALDMFPLHKTLYLTQSFRFGPAVAEMGNVFLRLSGSHPLVRGNPAIDSRVVSDMVAPDAILCRTNAGALAEAMEQLELGRVTYLQGGSGGMRRMAEAALDLQAGVGTTNPELCAFATWGELLHYVEVDPGGSDLRAFVRLVETYGAAHIIAACNRLGDSEAVPFGASRIPVGAIVVSTIHRAKGLEWPKVQIGRDVSEPRVDPETWTLREPDPVDMMLHYVAATRARQELDPGNLISWAKIEAALQ